MSTDLIGNAREHAPVEVERHATPNTAVLIGALRDKTSLRGGVVPADVASRDAEFPHITLDMGFVTAEKMRLAAELPYYEIAFRGKVYRILARPKDGPEDVHIKSRKFELIRTWAPGLCVDGWHLDAPVVLPNTPRALVEELQQVLGAQLEDILANAYSIFHYRLANKSRYPETMEPAGFTLRELFLMTVDIEGKLVTHYETPRGTNIELWTLFLHFLDRGSRTNLVPYTNSGMAIREFGEAGAQAMRESLRLRDGQARTGTQLHGKRFVELFPIGRKVTREVGQLTGHW